MTVKEGTLAAVQKDAVRKLVESVEADKDKEMLAFIICCTMRLDESGQYNIDVSEIDSFIKNVGNSTDGIWNYIDRELYKSDYEPETRIYHILFILSKIILSTQTIENTVRIAREYNHDLTSVLIKTFHNNGIFDIFSPSGTDPQFQLWRFLSLMISKQPFGLGLWKEWVTPADLLIPLEPYIAQAAFAEGLITSDKCDSNARNSITEYFRKIYPDNPSKGYFALRAESDTRS